MSKQKWIEHIQGLLQDYGGAPGPYGPGLLPPSQGGNAEEWHRIVTKHRAESPKCPECRARAAAKKRAETRKIMAQVNGDLGLVKVRGNLGGTYWE